MKKLRFILKKNRERLPQKPGVYCFKNDNEILYIGKSANIRERVKNHFEQPSFKDHLFLEKVKEIGYIQTNSEIEALILEANLIKELKPKFNVLWRDDKNYFFVGVTREDFPLVFITHQPKLKPETFKISTEFIGPFVDGRALKKTLKVLRKIFPFRTCKNIPKKPCLWYHLKMCLAPCLREGKEQGSKVKLQIEAQKNAQKIITILREGKKSLLKELKKEMKKAAREKNFEEAARLRDQIVALEKTLAHARVFEEKREFLPEWEEEESELKKVLKTTKEISRIEAFDVSNMRGKWATGAMVTFIRGVPAKKFYRKFKIKFREGPDDIAMIKEVLERRFAHPEWGFPHLILIDGGKAQLNVAIKIKNQKSETKNIKVAALSKGKNELYIEGKGEPILLKNLKREISNLILHLDREAHRFAITYHKKLREKEILKK